MRLFAGADFLKGFFKVLTFYLSIIEDESDRLFFERIYNLYADDIFRRVYGILKNMHDAEDAVQDTWQKIYEHIAKLKPMNERVRRAYIMSIAKNQSLTILRKRKKEENILCDIDTADVAEEGDDFASCEGEDIAFIVACMQKLGERYSDILVYYYLHNHSLKEIAKMMGLSVNTVGSRLARGRQKLIEMLERRNTDG